MQVAYTLRQQKQACRWWSYAESILSPMPPIISESGRRSLAAWTSPTPSGLMSLEEENNKLTRLLADALLDNAALKYGFTKVVSPQARREAVAALKTERQFSEPRACGLMNISISVLRFVPGLTHPGNYMSSLFRLPIKATLWLSTYPILLVREGWCVNVKRLYRLYRNVGLVVRKRNCEIVR